ncbi:histone acetyltransferase KAT6B-like isoform X5 [Ostrea edulis]|uniref:histone acetyltransferase KAT6B-like isoform X5 n=1 Tax=Ostrea edulis TaxID=37623 RepID=UPI002094C1B2|nr:histone acetyltransferase KAT6B-like isoform X5 [Ostrea edulis]
MASQKCKESILQIIDQLRQRKARPDIVRICHMAARKHGMKWQETESHLEKLVESGTVVKVDYKGNVSYRNTTKWKKTHSWKKIVHSDLVCKNIISAVREIAQNSLDRGASVKEVDRWLNTNTPEPHLERNQIRAALDKEVENGHLKKLPNGNYISSESSNPEKKIAEKPSTSVTSPGKRGRPPSKRKKFKKTHGPDFETLSFGKRSMEDSSCDYCLQTEPIIRKEFKEGILVCQDCNAKGKWECQTCQETGAVRASMEVDEVNDIADDSRDENNTSCLPTPYESAASSDDDNRRVEVKRRSEEGSPSDQKKVYYPDASKWGVDDVARFFINLGYKDQAEALQEQIFLGDRWAVSIIDEEERCIDWIVNQAGPRPQNVSTRYETAAGGCRHRVQLTEIRL